MTSIAEQINYEENPVADCVRVSDTSSNCLPSKDSSCSILSSIAASSHRIASNESHSQPQIIFQKTSLIEPTNERMNQLTNHLMNRLICGDEETIYQVGVSEDGKNGVSEEQLNSSIANVCKVTANLDADCILLKRRADDFNGHIAEYSVRKRAQQNDFEEVRVTCCLCAKTYAKKQHLMDHMMILHFGSQYNYSCKVCGHTTAWRTSLLKHVKRQHPEKKPKEMLDVLFVINKN